MVTVASIGSRITAARTFVIAISLFLAAVAPLLAGSAASAHSCAGNKVCLYQNKEFGGSGSEYVISSSGCHNLGFLNELVSSVVNNTNYHIRYYMNANCNDAGCYLQDGSYDYRRNLANDTYTTCSGWSPNDDISSFKVY